MPAIPSSTVNMSLYSMNCSLAGHGFWRAAQILVCTLFVILELLVVAIPLAVVLGAAAWAAILLVR
jgi:hypothetical protein